jgi:ribosomal protein S18 acetylase RimI-like enzyme
MTLPFARIAEIEAATYRCWPAAEVVEYDGWQLRYADGFSRRANSVYPAAPSTLDLGLKLDWCRSWYAERGLDLVVRQTPATEPGLDDVLAERGFTEEGRTDVMAMQLPVADGPPYLITGAPSALWWEAMAELWGIGADRREAWRAIIDRIDLPGGYGLVIDGNVPTAAGLAVADGPWVGLFEVVVADQWRRRGIGRDLTRSLMAWGKSQGAQQAFLQVVAQNLPAIEMYLRLGFTRTYGYWYRRAPEAG